MSEKKWIAGRVTNCKIVKLVCQVYRIFAILSMTFFRPFYPMAGRYFCVLGQWGLRLTLQRNTKGRDNEASPLRPTANPSKVHPMVKMILA